MVIIRRNAETKVGVSQLGYLGFGVSDLPAWRRFATDALGLQENGGRKDGAAFYRLDDYHHRLEVQPTGEDDIVLVGWEVKDAEALDEMTARVRAFGLEVETGTAEEAADRKVLGLIRFKDPDGLATEIYYGPVIDHAPFVSPRGVRGFKAGALGLGHLVLIVENTERYVEFATTVLGARLSDYIFSTHGDITLKLTFLHVNPRHHSIAVFQRDALPPTLRGRRAHHFMLEVEDLDDVGMALEQFKKLGLPTGDLGRHSNDRMLSFYGRTPSGFEVEYGWGALTIDDEVWEVQQHHAASLWGHGRPAPIPAS